MTWFFLLCPRALSVTGAVVHVHLIFLGLNLALNFLFLIFLILYKFFPRSAARASRTFPFSTCVSVSRTPRLCIRTWYILLVRVHHALRVNIYMRLYSVTNCAWAIVIRAAPNTLSRVLHGILLLRYRYYTHKYIHIAERTHRAQPGCGFLRQDDDG